jgi:HD-like signal output (HDOD) protein
VNPDGQDIQKIADVQNFRAEVLARKDLPTIPAVLSRILSVLDGERSSARDLVEVIEHDQALTSKVLKLANSAFFGFSRHVATIPRAVVLLGFATVRNLAMGVKVWDALAGAGRHREMAETLWAHSALVAAGARLIAARVRGVDPDASFTSGLLHDVGKLVISLKLGMPYWALLRRATAESCAVDVLEREHLGVDHAQVGGWLMDAWRLPPGVVAAVRLHHAPPAEPEWSPARVINVADRLLHGSDLETGDLVPAAAALLEETAASGLTVESWAEMCASIRAEQSALRSLLAGE